MPDESHRLAIGPDRHEIAAEHGARQQHLPRDDQQDCHQERG